MTAPGLALVTECPADCDQSADEAVTPLEKALELESLRRDPVRLRGHDLGRRLPAKLRQVISEAEFSELLADRSERQDKRHATEQARLLLTIREAIAPEDHERAFEAALVLHRWLVRDRMVPLDALSPAMQTILRLPGAHWRVLRCVTCRYDFATYHAPRSKLCRGCAADKRRERDRERRRAEREIAVAPSAVTCPCGAPLEAARRTKRYCSPACRQAAYRIRRPA